MSITIRRPARFAFAPALCAALCATVAVSCSAAPRDRSDLVLGTVCSVRILDGGDRRALDAAFERLRGIEASMSANAEGTNAEGTVVAGINAGAGAVVGVATGDLTIEALGRHRHTHLLASLATLPDLVASL